MLPLLLENMNHMNFNKNEYTTAATCREASLLKKGLTLEVLLIYLHTNISLQYKLNAYLVILQLGWGKTNWKENIM